MSAPMVGERRDFGSVHRTLRARGAVPSTPERHRSRTAPERGPWISGRATLLSECARRFGGPISSGRAGACRPTARPNHEGTAPLHDYLRPYLGAPMSSPAFQFYARDWIMSTRVLTLEQRGLHMDLLCFGWDYDGIPSDVNALAGLVGLTPQKFSKLWAAIESKWPDAEEGKRRNARQEAQRKELKDYRDAQAENGKKGAEARWGK